MRTITGFAAFLVAAPLSVAQVTVLKYPPLTIAGSTLKVSVTYDASTQVYRYEYTVVAPSTNRASIDGFSIDLAGTNARPQLDPSLPNNIQREETQIGTFQPPTTIPVGIHVPNGTWYADISVKGVVAFSGLYPASLIAAGTSMSGFVLLSKQPPGPRNAVLSPSTEAWDQLPPPPEGVEYEVTRADVYDITVATIGPIDPTDANLYNGGGQQPSDVNKFLRYSQPLDNRLKLPAGTTSYAVIVYYGATIIPSTFLATLNGADVTSQFTPIPGSAQVVTIPISGTTKLKLSVDGVKVSGAKATDTDTLTFLPQ